jgi:hypothetical protein
MATKKFTTNSPSSRQQRTLAATLDAHYDEMLQLAREIDQSRAQFNDAMLRLLTTRAVKREA